MLAYVSIPTSELGRIKSTHLHVLQALMGYANRDGICWPSLRTLAETCGLQLSRVQRAVSEMAALGYIHVKRRIGSSQLYEIAARFLARTPSPASRTRERPASAPVSAPASPATRTEESEVATLDSSKGIPVRRFAPPSRTATPAGRKEWVQQQVSAWIAKRLHGARQAAAWAGLLSDDPQEANRWLDTLDRQRRAENWVFRDAT